MTSSQREQLLEGLRGQAVRIPDLRPIFSGWAGAYGGNISPHLKELVGVVDEKLQSLFANEAKLARLKAADFALFASSWWPQAGIEELRILTFLAIWLFTWDDEIDEPTGSCTDDFKAAQAYRLETMNFIEHCLGLGTSSVHPLATNPIIESFRVIGERFYVAYNHEQRKRFFKEIVLFLAKSQHEQEIRLSGRIPSIEEYRAFRMGTSAVGVGIAALEFANKARISGSIMEDPNVKCIWTETNIIISM
ncbi:MAG: hypothetical protein LQ338_006850 [Usnochroma carphineum]|nr:MAG: hypothetical protein LQ338_006850 [Usnochroma carphineum]